MIDGTISVMCSFCHAKKLFDRAKKRGAVRMEIVAIQGLLHAYSSTFEGERTWEASYEKYPISCTCKEYEEDLSAKVMERSLLQEPLGVRICTCLRVETRDGVARYHRGVSCSIHGGKR